MKVGVGRRSRDAGALMLVLVFALGGHADGARARVALRWEPVAGATAYDLEIAKDPKFTEVVLRERVTVAGYRWSELPSVTYYWRVRSIDAEGREGPWSVARAISSEVAPPKLAGSAGPMRLPCVPNCSLPVAFEAQPVIEQYVLEVSPSPDFAQAQKVKGTASPLRAELPGPGVYYYRLSGVDVAGRQTAAGETRVATAFAPAPSPETPINGAVLPFDASVPTGFTWSAPEQYQRFELEYRRAGAPALSGTATARSTSKQLDAQGAWTWRVRAVLENGTRTDWSSPASFVVAPGAPQLEGPADQTSFGTRRGARVVALTWKGAAAAFVVQTSSSPGFEPKSEAVAPCCTLEVQAALGKTFWRVVPKDAQGNVGAPSMPRSFEVTALSALATPALSAPIESASVPPGEVQLSWAAVPEAASYEVELQPGAAITTAEPKAALSLLEEGEYRVRVRGFDAEGVPGEFSEARAFFVGPPPSVRLERVGEWPKELNPGEEAEVRVALLDARGRRVQGTAPRVKHSDAELPAAAASDATWRVKVRAPEARRERSEVRLEVADRGFVATESIPVLAAGGPVRVTAQLGIANTFGSVVAPYAGVDAWMPLRGVHRSFAAGLRAGGFGRSLDAPDALGEAGAGLSYRVMPIAATASWVQRVSRFELRGGAGAGISAFWAETREEAGGGVSPHALIFASAGTRVGPGVLSLDASVGFGRGDQDFARLRTGAAIFALSYGMDP